MRIWSRSSKAEVSVLKRHKEPTAPPDESILPSRQRYDPCRQSASAPALVPEEGLVTPLFVMEGLGPRSAQLGLLLRRGKRWDEVLYHAEWMMLRMGACSLITRREKLMVLRLSMHVHLNPAFLQVR